MSTQLGVDPTSATNNNHTAPQFTLGEDYEYAHADYGKIVVRYYKAEDADWAAGSYLERCDNWYEATKDRSGGSAIDNVPAGVALCAVTDGKYGFVQVRGTGAVALTTDGSVDAGEPLVRHSTDGQVIGFALTSILTLAQFANAFGIFGKALAADSSTTLAAGNYILQIP